MSKDVKKMVGEIRGALDKYPREQLQEILAYVFKEYVVEGSPASATGALAMLDARTELEGLSFAELMTWLQLHVDLPELALFEVAGGRVHVRAGGRSIPIEAARAPEPQAMPVTPTPPVVTTAPALPTTAAPQAATTPAPRPMPPEPRSSPTPASSPQPMPPPVAPSPSHQAPPATPPNQAPAPPTTSSDKKDEAASPANRFSWLEVD